MTAATEQPALRVALLARGFHYVDAVGFVGLCGDVPGFGAGGCGDCGLLPSFVSS